VEEKETDRIPRSFLHENNDAEEERRARGPHASPTLPTWESWGKWAACDPHVANTSFFFFFYLKIGLILISVVNIIF
jgi:hypothetical protein